MAGTAIQIEAVIVNHNTSAFVELALRSLFDKNANWRNLRVTVMDNASDDAELGDLRRFAASRDIPIVQSGFVRAGEAVNSHGEVLADFVLSHPECGYYLFMDADICFIEDDTINVMQQGLETDPAAFAIQPRATWDGKTETRGRGGFHTEPVEGFDLVLHWALGYPDTPKEALPGLLRSGRWQARERCHPFCALIRNTPVFRRVVEHIGLSEAWIFDNRNRHGGFYDTLGLASHVMRTHGRRWICSSKMVFHFFNVSYDDQWKVEKLRKCRQRLAELRRRQEG